jgi:hypothetical protein
MSGRVIGLRDSKLSLILKVSLYGCDLNSVAIRQEGNGTKNPPVRTSTRGSIRGGHDEVSNSIMRP